MLLKVMYYQDEDGRYTAITRYEGHTKAWHSDTITNLKKTAGSWLGRAHRYGIMGGISQMTFVEGHPKDDTVWLVDEPERRHYRRRKVVTDQGVKCTPVNNSVAVDEKEYLYKEENGYLKVYSKTLVGSFPIAKSIGF